MQVFDASSLVHAWDNYPAHQFPGLWQWISTQIDHRRIVLPSVAYIEICNRAPDCGEWLAAADIERLEITNTIIQDAMRIKGLLEIVDDRYHPKGVGENDLLIICTARAHRRELVSDEGRQNIPPEVKSKRKIPSVCSMREVSVPCINFIEYIKRTNFVFG